MNLTDLQIIKRVYWRYRNPFCGLFKKYFNIASGICVCLGAVIRELNKGQDSFRYTPIIEALYTYVQKTNYPGVMRYMSGELTIYWWEKGKRKPRKQFLKTFIKYMENNGYEYVSQIPED